MLHTKHLRQAFIAQKGFSAPSKDAMEQISEKAVEIIESKKEEVIEKVGEQLEEKKEEIAEKVDEVADKAEEVVEKAAADVSKKIEEAAKPLTDLIDNNPHVAEVLDTIGDQFDGREVSCSCFDWLFVLRISRKTKATPPSKSEEKPKEEKAVSSQDVQVKVEPQPTPPPS